MKTKEFKTKKELTQKQSQKMIFIESLENDLIDNNINDRQFTLICKDMHNI